VNAKKCKSLLSAGKGSSIAIVLGGAQESLDSKPGTVNLTLLERKGFVAIALAHGASIVPTFSFGENDLWIQVENPTGSTIRNVQEWMKRHITFTLPLFHGRGIFQYDYGMLPYRKPIRTVIGQPIHLPKIEGKIPKEEIEKYHQIYLKSLSDLYNKYKDIYHKDRVNDSIQFH